MHKSIILLILLTACIFGGSALAGKNQDSVFSEYGLSSEDVSYRLVTMQRHLNLTDQQFARLRDVFDRYDSQFGELTEEKQQYEITLSRMLESGKLNEKDLNHTARKLGDVTARIAILRVSNRAEMYNTLSPAQQIKFREYWQQGKGGNKAGEGQGSHW